MDFEVNPNTGSVLAIWFEQPSTTNNKTSQQDPVHTKCFRC
jgi:hypothetical protein